MKRLPPSIIFGVIAVVVALLPDASLCGKETKDAPTSLIITYKARPETRAAFRAYWETQGARQFEQWEKSGIIRAHHIIFTSYAGTGQFDAAAILEFGSYADTARWTSLERSMPGGLAVDGLALAVPTSSNLGDVLGQSEASGRNPAGAVFTIASYDVVVDAAKYAKYFAGYVLPQINGWIAEGMISGYHMYWNQNAPGAPWAAMLVLEYQDMGNLGRRAAVKDKVKAQLAGDPVWSAFNKEQVSIRRETSIVIGEAVLPKSP